MINLLLIFFPNSQQRSSRSGRVCHRLTLHDSSVCCRLTGIDVAVSGDVARWHTLLMLTHYAAAAAAADTVTRGWCSQRRWRKWLSSVHDCEWWRERGDGKQVYTVHLHLHLHCRCINYPPRKRRQQHTAHRNPQTRYIRKYEVHASGRSRDGIRQKLKHFFLQMHAISFKVSSN